LLEIEADDQCLIERIRMITDASYMFDAV